MERPPPRATLPPHRERAWTAESQRRILQDELLPLSFYRRLLEADDVTRLEQLEREFDAFVAVDCALDDDATRVDGTPGPRFSSSLEVEERWEHPCRVPQEEERLETIRRLGAAAGTPAEEAAARRRASARDSGATAKTASPTASARMPPSPSITHGPNCGSRTSPAISSR